MHGYHNTIIAVKDFPSAVAWYEQLLGHPADSIPMDGLAEWHIVEGSWLQVFQNTDRAGATWITLQVTDLDDQLTELKSKDLYRSGEYSKLRKNCDGD